MNSKVCARTDEVKSVLDKALIDLQKKIQDVVSFAPNPGNLQRIPIAVIINECENVLRKVPEEISYVCNTNPFK